MNIIRRNKILEYFKFTENGELKSMKFLMAFAFSLILIVLEYLIQLLISLKTHDLVNGVNENLLIVFTCSLISIGLFLLLDYLFRKNDFFFPSCVFSIIILTVICIVVVFTNEWEMQSEFVWFLVCALIIPITLATLILGLFKHKKGHKNE